MAQARHLRNAPIREAVMEFQFLDVSLNRAAMELLAEPYVKEQWSLQEVNAFSATLGPVSNTAAPVSLTTETTFEGLSVFDGGQRHVVQFYPNRVTVSNILSYDTWEHLEEQAERAFEAFVKAGRPEAVVRISSRFINRVPPHPQFTTYEAILERPPLPLDGLGEARVSDFLRRHVIENLENDLIANLTIGTVAPEPSEITSHTKALVIDIDVFKSCRLAPSFEDVKAEMVSVRKVKNALFFGSLKDAAVERFV